ncbi:MAG: proteophosphoglycan ppg4 [Variovorax sp.]|nr:MAG: proteophosphoglycan ppg4 [Variovorax sp.]
MNKYASILAALALGTASAAFAQGNPPTTAPANPALGAGQQNPVGGPMGTTGTQAQNPGTAAPATGGMTNNTNSGTTMAPAAPAAEPMRPARADRN